MSTYYEYILLEHTRSTYHEYILGVHTMSIFDMKHAK